MTSIAPSSSMMEASLFVFFSDHDLLCLVHESFLVLGPPGSPPGPGMALPVEDSQPLERRNGIRLCPTKLFHEIQAKEAGEVRICFDTPVISF